MGIEGDIVFKHVLTALLVIVLVWWPEAKVAAQNDELLLEAMRQCLSLKKQGRYADAEPLYKRSLKIRERVLETAEFGDEGANVIDDYASAKETIWSVPSSSQLMNLTNSIGLLYRANRPHT